MAVSWARDGVAVVETESLKVQRIDEVTSLLSITGLAARHSGNYSCQARNAVAVATAAARLTVQGREGDHSNIAVKY